MRRSTERAASVLSTPTTEVGSMVEFADMKAMPVSARVSRMIERSEGSQVSRQVSPSSAKSSPPASRAASISSSSSTVRSKMTTPLRSNCQATAPGSASDPPLRVNSARTSELVRLRLSVSVST